jgi:hypothetical protein
MEKAFAYNTQTMEVSTKTLYSNNTVETTASFTSSPTHTPLSKTKALRNTTKYSTKNYLPHSMLQTSAMLFGQKYSRQLFTFIIAQSAKIRHKHHMSYGLANGQIYLIYTLLALSHLFYSQKPTNRN